MAHSGHRHIAMHTEPSRARRARAGAAIAPPCPAHRLAASCSRPASSRSTIPQPAQTGPRVQALRGELSRRGLSRLHRAARRPPPERIRAAVRGAAGLADRLHRLGRAARGARRPRRAVRRRPLHAAGARPGRCRGRSRSCTSPRRRPSAGSKRICRPAPSSATTPGCTPSTAPSGSARACANAGADAGAGRAQSDRRDLDRPAGAAARRR